MIHASTYEDQSRKVELSHSMRMPKRFERWFETSEVVCRPALIVVSTREKIRYLYRTSCFPNSVHSNRAGGAVRVHRIYESVSVCADTYGLSYSSSSGKVLLVERPFGFNIFSFSGGSFKILEP